jgi:hypothetical protein
VLDGVGDVALGEGEPGRNGGKVLDDEGEGLAEDGVGVDESAMVDSRISIVEMRESSRKENERVNPTDKSSTPDVNGHTILDPRRRTGEAPLRSKELERRNDHSSSSTAQERNEDHRPGRVTNGLVRVSEDDVDAESGHAHDAGEAIDEAEEGLAREGREGEEERGEAEFVGEEREEAVRFRFVSTISSEVVGGETHP